MDITIHVAAAAVTCQAALYLEAHTPNSSLSARRPYFFGTGCFTLGVLSHLALDAIPHYDVLYKLGNAFKPGFLPGILWTGLKVGVLTLPIILWFLFLSRDHPKFALAALAGGLYPDFEKGAYLSTLLPRWFVLFPFHSCAYSPAGWEVQHRYALIAAEIGLLSGLLALMHWFGQKQAAQQTNLGGSFKEWCVELVLYFTVFIVYRMYSIRRRTACSEKPFGIMD